MKCNCSVGNIVLAIIILIFAFWQTSYSQWVVVVAAVLLIIHELWHKHSWMGMNKGMSSDMAVKKKKR